MCARLCVRACVLVSVSECVRIIPEAISAARATAALVEGCGGCKDGAAASVVHGEGRRRGPRVRGGSIASRADAAAAGGAPRPASVPSMAGDARQAGGGGAAADASEPGTPCKRVKVPPPGSDCPAPADALCGGAAASSLSDGGRAASGVSAGRGALLQRLLEATEELRSLAAAGGGALERARLAELTAECGLLGASLGGHV